MFQAIDVTSELIKKANSKPILEIASKMGLLQDFSAKKICCPFVFHKKGGEKTPSFYFYQETNSFYCYGCKKGGGPTDLISSLFDESKISAAKRILSLEIDSFVRVEENRKFLLEDKYLKLSSLSRTKMKEIGVDRVEELLKAFDFLDKKYEDSPEKLSSIINNITNRIEVL